MVALVVLRLTIGFHFFSEGVNKVRDPKPFSAMFFGAAKGPFAPLFHGMVYDPTGETRLDVEANGGVWTEFVEQAKRHYRFDDKQAALADERLNQRYTQLKEYLGDPTAKEKEKQKGDIGEALDEYRAGLKYLAELDRQDRPGDKQVRNEVASLKGQWEKTDKELKAKRAPWLARVASLTEALEQDMFNIASEENRGGAALKASKPGTRFLDSEFMDRFIPYFDMTIGALLVIGLFTRLASVTGAMFLASVVASQWPSAPGAAPTAYQAIEMLALVVIALTGSGCFAGLDFFLARCCRKCCGGKCDKPAVKS